MDSRAPNIPPRARRAAPVDGASAAGTEEAMSEANLPTEQPPTGEAPRVPSPDVDPGGPRHRQSAPPERSPSPFGLNRLADLPPDKVDGGIWRVEQRQTFQHLRRGRRRRAGPLTVSWVPGNPAEPPRVAFTVGRQVGSAVLRNRLRRRLRMLMREAAPRLQPGAYLVGADPAAADLSYADLGSYVLEAIEKLEKA